MIGHMDPHASDPDPIECPVCGEAVEMIEQTADAYWWECPGCGATGGDERDYEPDEPEYGDGPEYADGVMF